LNNGAKNPKDGSTEWRTSAIGRKIGFTSHLERQRDEDERRVRDMQEDCDYWHKINHHVKTIIAATVLAAAICAHPFLEDYCSPESKHKREVQAKQEAYLAEQAEYAAKHAGEIQERAEASRKHAEREMRFHVAHPIIKWKTTT
jgi:hypothetical protein